jgi:hypothetical protein
MVVPSDGYQIHLLDRDFHEEIYMEQPSGFIQNDSSLVGHLKKTLYGLKQDPHA